MLLRGAASENTESNLDGGERQERQCQIRGGTLGARSGRYWLIG
jgi:hypothetical protein